MEKLDKYRTCIERLITEYGSYKPSYGEVETQLIFDNVIGHFGKRFKLIIVNY